MKKEDKRSKASSEKYLMEKCFKAQATIQLKGSSSAQIS